MKKYIVEYFSEDKSKPTYFTQLSKSGKKDGLRISFLINGKKAWQAKYKNDLRNGIYKCWQYNFKNNLLNGIDKDWSWNNSKNNVFLNWKKGNAQGIEINFNQ